METDDDEPTKKKTRIAADQMRDMDIVKLNKKKS